MATTTIPRSILATIPLLLTACGDDATAPASVAGQYTATTFNLVQAVDTTDVLAAGGNLFITLTASGTTTGQLFVPAALNGGTPFTASMDGTFTLNNGVVTFSQAADTFVRDLPFTVTGKALAGSRDFSGTIVIVVLIRP